MTGAPLRLACLISGGGRTMLNLADRIADGTLNATIDLVLASRADAAGIEHARARGFETLAIVRREFDSEQAMHDRISDLLRGRRIDLVCLCGYMRWFRVDQEFRGRVINIHPSLLPDFGGKGMHGLHVHQAVLEAGRNETGCTVHFVDDQYDHGPIILQRRCPVLPGDTPSTLAARVFEQECIAYPQAIARLSGPEAPSICQSGLPNDRAESKPRPSQL